MTVADLYSVLETIVKLDRDMFVCIRDGRDDSIVDVDTIQFESVDGKVVLVLS